MYWETKPFRLKEDCQPTTWQRTSSSRGSVEPFRLGSVTFSDAYNVSARRIFFFRDGRIRPNTKTEVALTPSEVTLADRMRVRCTGVPGRDSESERTAGRNLSQATVG